MSQWNLSVRLTGQGSDLAHTLRDVASDARSASNEVNALRRNLTLLRTEAANNIQVRVGIDADHLRADVDAALTTAGSGQGLSVRLNLDADHLRDDVNAALTTAGAGQGLAVNLRLADANQLRRDVEDAVRWAAWGHRIEIPIGLTDSMQLRRDVSAAVRWASMNQTIRIRVDADTSHLGDLTRTLRNGGGSAEGGLADALQGLLVLAPAAIPLAAGLSAELAPLAAQFTAAGVASAAFGIALAGQIQPLSDAADAEEKYQQAVVQHGATSQEAMEASLAYQQLLNQMPEATQKASIALSTLKGDFSDWSNSMARFTMKPVTDGIAILDSLIPRLTPEVQSASKELDRLVTVAGGAVATPGFDALADKLASFTSGKLDELTDEVIHLMRVLSEPGADHGVIATFVDYARSNAPAAREALQAIGQALIMLMQAASEAGPGILTVVTAVSRLVAALPPEAVAIIIQIASAIKLFNLAGAGVAATSGAITRLAASVAALRATAATAGGGILGLQAALASLSTKAKIGLTAGAIGALVLVLHEMADNKPAVQVNALSTSLNTLISTGAVTGTLKSNFNEISSSIAMVSKGASDNKLAQWTSDFGTWIGVAKGPSISTARKNVDAWDKSMAQLVQSGHPKEAAAQYELLKKAWKAGGGDMNRLKKSTDDYQNALADQKFESKMAAESMGLFGKAAQDTQEKLDAQKASADGLRQSIQALNDVNRDAGGAMNAFEQSIDDVAKAAKDNAGALSMSHGELDLNSQKARDAESALRDLAASTDDAAAKARDQGKSWEYVQGVYDRGQEKFVAAAQQMGLTKKQAEALAKSYLDIPDSKTTKLEMQKEDATRDLKAFNAALKASPGSKSVTLKTLSKAAETVLEAFGYKVRRLPDGSVTVSAATGSALSQIGSVSAALSNLDGKTATTYVITKTSTSNAGTVAHEGGNYADGGVVDYYANGGIQRGGIRYFASGAESHVAQIAPAGSWRVWGEPETGGEGYVPLALAKRPRSRKVTEEIVRRLGGDPTGIQWYADGGLDFSYSSTGGQAQKYTLSGLISASDDKKGNFSLAIFTKKLAASNNALAAWRKNLATVASRAGQDVADALAEMGDDGIALTKKMATGSSAYVKKMAKELENLAAAAKASLSEYTSQLKDAVKDQATFQANLTKLAAQGYGDLATRLAAQNDQDAEDLAAAAVKSKSKASAANSAAKSANNALSSDQLSELVSIIAAITTSKTGIHAVADTTGLGEDEIITVANKAKSQISKSLGSKATQFLADLARANKHLSYADGGIRAGLYATQSGIIRFAEPETAGEAYVPLSPSKRRTAIPVLTDVAHRFGLGLTDASAARPVVVVQSGDTTQVTVAPVRTGATATDIGAQVGRQVRRARRGGVKARAA